MPGYTDRRATECYASELERTAEHIRSGYKPQEHNHLNRSLNEHLNEMKEYLIAKGTSQKQAQQIYNRVLWVIESCGFMRWADISAPKVQEFLASMRRNKDKKRGISPQTSNGYLQAVKQFCYWLHGEGRAPDNPLTRLHYLNVNIDRRHDRRPLTPDESKLLLQKTTSEPPRFGMTGLERALLYWTAIETGLRANELKTLTVCCCKLCKEPFTLTVKAIHSKHRREDVQPIRAPVAEALAKYTSSLPSTDLVFKTMPPLNSVAKMLRADLKATGIEYRDSTGRVVDFHALRHTYITNLALNGVQPKIAMDLARHSDINLTLAFYSHTSVNDRAKALAKLPDLVLAENPAAL